MESISELILDEASWQSKRDSAKANTRFIRSRNQNTQKNDFNKIINSTGSDDTSKESSRLNYAHTSHSINAASSNSSSKWNQRDDRLMVSKANNNSEKKAAKDQQLLHKSQRKIELHGESALLNIEFK